MNRIFVLAFVVPLAVGCASTRTVPLHLTSQSRFEPAQRREVWGRAVTSLQIAGSIVKLTDPVGGVLLTEAQPTSTPCNNSVEAERPAHTGGAMGAARDEPRGPTMCPSTIIVQFTMTDEGLAVLRLNRGVYGTAYSGKALFTDGDLAALQNECESWLHYIVGKSSKPPNPPPPPPARTTRI
jgi:hypothetical protein